LDIFAYGLRIEPVDLAGLERLVGTLTDSPHEMVQRLYLLKVLEQQWAQNGFDVGAMERSAEFVCGPDDFIDAGWVCRGHAPYPSTINRPFLVCVNILNGPDPNIGYAVYVSVPRMVKSSRHHMIAFINSLEIILPPIIHPGELKPVGS